MALSFEQFMEATGAELVAGNIIVGVMASRKKVGELSDDGTFNLNDDGKALAEDIDTGTKRSRKKAEPAADAAPEASEAN